MSSESQSLNRPARPPLIHNATSSPLTDSPAWAATVPNDNGRDPNLRLTSFASGSGLLPVISSAVGNSFNRRASSPRVPVCRHCSEQREREDLQTPNSETTRCGRHSMRRHFSIAAPPMRLIVVPGRSYGDLPPLNGTTPQSHFKGSG